MNTIKGNKKNIKKEFKKFCDDLNFIPHFYLSKEYFAKMFINNEIVMHGLYFNTNLKTTDTEAITKEIIEILN